MPQSKQIVRQLPDMNLGNKPNDGGALSFGAVERRDILREHPEASRFIRRFYGSKEFNNDIPRYCLWIEDGFLHEARRIRPIHDRIELSRTARVQAEDANNQALAERPHQFREFNEAIHHSFVIPAMTSERREYLPCGLVGAGKIISSQAFTIFDAELWGLSLLLSRVHLIWIATICGKLKLDYRYSNDLGWNTFPVPNLTEQYKADLTRCAEDILLAREAHFPATIADLYKPETDDWKMPDNLRAAHDRNDETLERIYIGRRFKNDTERLEILFAMYAKMTKDAGAAIKGADSKLRGRKKKEVQA